jgi:hypothetical protein
LKDRVSPPTGGETDTNNFYYNTYGSIFTRDGKWDSDIERRLNSGNNVNVALHAFMGSRVVHKKALFALQNRVLLPTLINIWKWELGMAEEAYK